MNNSEHNDLDKLLKDSLSDKGANVPASVWDHIEAELFPKKKRRGFFWLFFSGAVVIGGLAAGLFLFNRPAAHHASADRSAKTHLPGHRPAPKATGIPVAPLVPVEEQQEPVALAVSETPSTTSTIAGEPFKAKTAGTPTRAGHRSGLLTGKSDREVLEIRTSETPGTSSGTSGDPFADNRDSGTTDLASSSATATETPADHISDQPGRVDSLATLRIMPVGNGLADFLVPRNRPEKSSRCGIVVYGGPSLFDMALFKDYFVSGDLSNRSFAASGIEAGVSAYVQSNRFGWYTNLSFNRKQAAFQYNVAITEADYFEYIADGELPGPSAAIPFENISDNGANSCFLAKDFTASYTVTSWQLALGGTVELLRWRKLSLGADLRLGLNMSSRLALDEWTIFSQPAYEKERFSAVRPAGGLWIWYQLSRRFAIGLTPMYSWQFQWKSSFTAGTTKELIVPFGIRFGL